MSSGKCRRYILTIVIWIKCFTDYGIFFHMAPAQYSFMGLLLQLHQFIGGVYAYNACLLVLNISHLPLLWQK